METLRRTPLYERQIALGARIVAFAGWEMPVQYTGIVEEHLAVRERAGVFDVSHMGQLALAGSEADAYLQSALTNDLGKIGPGQAQYTLLLNERAGVIDDLIAYRGEAGFLLVVNAANVEADAGVLAETRNVSDEFSMLAVQGPAALSLLGVDVEPHTWREETVLGVDCMLCGTGYTGERGCELLCAPDDAGLLWDRVLEQGIVPCGLGARDTLRLEACYPLHGSDLTLDRTPVEAGLAWACALDKEFPGVEVLRRQAAEGPQERLAALVLDERGAIPRAGMKVIEGGEVTSGGFSPMLELGVALAYLPAELALPGTGLTVDIRGREKAAHVVRKPIYGRKE